MVNDWDLSAIVRSCSTVAAAAAKCLRRDGEDEVGKTFDGIRNSGDYGEDDRNEVYDPLDELQHVYKPFYRISAAVAADSGSGGSENKHLPLEYYRSHKDEQPEVSLQRQGQRRNAEDNVVASRRRIPSQTPARRRKCRPRLMIRVNAKTLAKDSWSWRKYGQKPIKGSPHPRNYYRCSTSKACRARKQVELNQDNPEEYIVSYIGEHIHARPTARRSAAATATNPPTPCSAASLLSPTPPLKTQKPEKGDEKENSDPMFEEEEDEEEEDEEEEGDIDLIPNMQASEETIMAAMHVLSSRASQPIVTKPHLPAKGSVNAAGSSDMAPLAKSCF